MPVDLSATYEKYFPLIREKCRRALTDRGEAEDVAQETFIRLWQSHLSGEDPRQITAWIYRTSTRLTIDRFRSRQHRDALHGAVIDRRGAASGAPGNSEARQQLERLARQLPKRELEIALLHRVDGLSQPQIAEVTQISERTIRRLLQKLDQRLERFRTEALS